MERLSDAEVEALLKRPAPKRADPVEKLQRALDALRDDNDDAERRKALAAALRRKKR